MPFPNVTSHRRMPHLPNTPKTNSPQVPAAAAAQQEQQQPDHGLTTLPTRELENGSSTLRLTASGIAGSSSSSQKLLQDSSQSAHQLDHNVGLLPASSSSSVAALPGRIKDGNDMLDQDRHHTSPGGGVGSPLGALSLSSASLSSSTSPSLTTQDSKMIKTALYDAFGVLYHPSAHTKHSLSTTAAALRSGDVTPLMGLSPKASPLLRPQYLGTSAPITPLELSEEASASGYFGLHLPTTSSAASVASPALVGTAAANSTAAAAGPGPASSYHGHHHYHHQHQHHHHHHPHRHTHTSSHLSATFTNNENLQEDELSSLPAGRGYRSPLSRSRRTSVDLTLDPAEHPVLSSLQTLSITHPHPPEHYHPHLGHDLGHDRVPIAADSPAAREQHASSSTMKLTLPATSSATTFSSSSTTTTTTAATASNADGRASAATGLQQQQQQQQQHRTEHSSSPFPMDRGDRDSISGFGQQGLV
ncbi:hypothetical protein BGW39_000902 [Mortierella sp. 14UC]|nr:hypothetical protein BGW39_000902 [Mortierella sp. 14UC]